MSKNDHINCTREHRGQRETAFDRTESTTGNGEKHTHTHKKNEERRQSGAVKPQDCTTNALHWFTLRPPHIASKLYKLIQGFPAFVASCFWNTKITHRPTSKLTYTISNWTLQTHLIWIIFRGQVRYNLSVLYKKEGKDKYPENKHHLQQKKMFVLFAFINKSNSNNKDALWVK